jgi:hypothetical protein
MVTYDARNMEWPLYCSLMAELFSSNDIGTVPEENWREWAAALSQLGNFGQSGVPDSRGFETWQDWAEQLVGIMSIGTA